MTGHLRITVYGTPGPQGSKRHVGNGVMVESSKKVAPWREDVKLAALRCLEECHDWDRDHPEVHATVTFTLPRPRSHFRTGKFSHLLRDGAPQFVGKKPDLDKLLRSTGDALSSAGVWADDARLAQAVITKCYAGADVPGSLDRPGAVIVLTGGSV